MFSWCLLLFFHYSYFSVELHFPTNLDDLNQLAGHLQQYKKDHLGYVMVLFCSAYLYKQTFAIPGSVFMVSKPNITSY